MKVRRLLAFSEAEASILPAQTSTSEARRTWHRAQVRPSFAAL